jgi:hypothetical protein
MNETKGIGSDGIKVKVLNDSVKFYLPRVEGYYKLCITWPLNMEECHLWNSMVISRVNLNQ